MKTGIAMILMGSLLVSAPAVAQQKTVIGGVSDEQGAPLCSVSVVIKGTTTGTLSNAGGNFTIRASVGEVLQFKFIGTVPAERVVGADTGRSDRSPWTANPPAYWSMQRIRRAT